MKKFFTILLFLSLSITLSFSNELMVKGNKAYQKNDFDKAIEYFKQAQDKDKNNPETITIQRKNPVIEEGKEEEGKEEGKEEEDK